MPTCRSIKRDLFVYYLLGDSNGNVTDAARRAGLAHPNVTGHRLLRNASVREAIARKVGEAAISADENLARIAEQATGTMADFVDIDRQGNPTLNLRKAKRRGKLALIKKLSHTQFGPAIELYDAQAALFKLGTYHGLFVEKVDINRRLNVEDLSTEELAELRERFARRGRGRPAANGTGLN